jgi:hypothetical protein
VEGDTDYELSVALLRERGMPGPKGRAVGALLRSRRAGAAAQAEVAGRLAAGVPPPADEVAQRYADALERFRDWLGSRATVSADVKEETWTWVLEAVLPASARARRRGRNPSAAASAREAWENWLAADARVQAALEKRVTLVAQVPYASTPADAEQWRNYFEASGAAHQALEDANRDMAAWDLHPDRTQALRDQFNAGWAGHFDAEAGRANVLVYTVNTDDATVRGLRQALVETRNGLAATTGHADPVAAWHAFSTDPTAVVLARSLATYQQSEPGAPNPSAILREVFASDDEPGSLAPRRANSPDPSSAVGALGDSGPGGEQPSTPGGRVVSLADTAMVPQAERRRLDLELHEEAGSALAGELVDRLAQAVKAGVDSYGPDRAGPVRIVGEHGYLSADLNIANRVVRLLERQVEFAWVNGSGVRKVLTLCSPSDLPCF